MPTRISHLPSSSVKKALETISNVEQAAREVAGRVDVKASSEPLDIRKISDPALRAFAQRMVKEPGLVSCGSGALPRTDMFFSALESLRRQVRFADENRDGRVTADEAGGIDTFDMVAWLLDQNSESPVPVASARAVLKNLETELKEIRTKDSSGVYVVDARDLKDKDTRALFKSLLEHGGTVSCGGTTGRCKWSEAQAAVSDLRAQLRKLDKNHDGKITLGETAGQKLSPFALRVLERANRTEKAVTALPPAETLRTSEGVAGLPSSDPLVQAAASALSAQNADRAGIFAAVKAYAGQVPAGFDPPTFVNYASAMASAIYSSPKASAWLLKTLQQQPDAPPANFNNPAERFEAFYNFTFQLLSQSI
jgi:hypothetical protein